MPPTPSYLPKSNAANLPQVELWSLREDVINLAPIEFTLVPGASADQYKLHKYDSSALPGDPV